MQVCQRLLQQQLQANSSGVRLLQVCVLDHSSEEYEQPHLHIKCHFSNGEQAPWESIYNTNMLALREALHRLQPSLRVQVHVHADEPPEEEVPLGVSDAFFEALPKVVLAEQSAERLVADGTDACPFCLDNFAPGDELLLFPCPGCHKAHAECSQIWLQGATTCPTCRFALPTDLPTSRTLCSLLEDANHEATRIRENGLPPCLPIDEETPELAELSMLFHSGRPSARPDAK